MVSALMARSVLGCKCAASLISIAAQVGIGDGDRAAGGRNKITQDRPTRPTTADPAVVLSSAETEHVTAKRALERAARWGVQLGLLAKVCLGAG